MAINVLCVAKIFIMMCSCRERTGFEVHSVIKQRPWLPHLPELYFFPFFELHTVVPQMDHINSLFHNFFFLFYSPAFIILHLCFWARVFPGHKAAQTERKLALHVSLYVHCSFVFQLGVPLMLLAFKAPFHIHPPPLPSCPPVCVSGRKMSRLTQCFRNVNTHKLRLSHGCLLSPPVCHVVSGEQECV